MYAAVSTSRGCAPAAPEAELLFENFLAALTSRPPSSPEAAAAALKKSSAETDERLRAAGLDPALVRAAVGRRGAALADKLRTCESAADGVAAFGAAFSDALREVYSDVKDEDHLIAGLMMFLAVYVVQLLIDVVALALMGPAGAFVVYVVSPALTEEFGRWIATRGGYGGSYTAVINAYEFVTYVATFASGAGFVRMVLVRTLAVAIHTSMALLQRWGHDRDLAAGKQNPGRNAFIAAVLIHAAYNATAVVLEAGAKALVGR